MTRKLALGGVLLFVALGLLFASGTALLLAIIPVAYLIGLELSRIPPGTELHVERQVAPEAPRLGAEVDVTLSVANRGDTTLADLRVVDQVPDELAVIDGSPRGAFALRPGETALIEYTVIATRGRHPYDPVQLRARPGLSATTEDLSVTAAGDDAIDCRGAAAAPVAQSTQLRAGTLSTDQAGEGIEFRSVREYRHGDSVSRIDWRQYAKTGDLTTVEYREERALRFLILVDVRAETHQVPAPGYPSGMETTAYAGRLLYEALEGAGHNVAAAAVGVSTAGLGGKGLAWIDDRDPRPPTDVFELAENASQNRIQPGIQKQIRTLLRPDTHVIVVSPVPDEWPIDMCRELRVGGYTTTAIVPEWATDTTLGGRISGMEWDLRVTRLAKQGIDTIRWPRDESLRRSLERSLSEVLDQ